MEAQSFAAELGEIKRLLWGPLVRDEVFRRWEQGLQFSKDEPTALVQWEGGPCAILAPLQAFILKHVIGEDNSNNNWRMLPPERCDRLLVRGVCEILHQAQCEKLDGDSSHFSLVQLHHGNSTSNDCDDDDDDGDGGGGSSSSPSKRPLLIGGHTEKEADQRPVNQEEFHSRLRPASASSVEEMEKVIWSQLSDLRGTMGVLLFLYSLVRTKGVGQLRREMSDPTEPLIDSTHGHGSQSLINLALTGRAVSHVWDHSQDVGGMQLQGVDRQSEVGFLTLLEHLRYCEVGSYLKNPVCPVWVLGSETHLTVLFSRDPHLVSPERPSDAAKRVFKTFDPEGNNFISTVLLEDILKACDLVSDTEYVEVMKKKLDSEGLGIILLRDFMDEFFPNEDRDTPDTFTLYHYNGLPRSSPGNKVVYQEGQAIILECEVKCVNDSNPMQTCLQTKWANIEVQWKGDVPPSLN